MIVAKKPGQITSKLLRQLVWTVGWLGRSTSNLLKVTRLPKVRVGAFAWGKPFFTWSLLVMEEAFSLPKIAVVFIWQTAVLFFLVVRQLEIIYANVNDVNHLRWTVLLGTFSSFVDATELTRFLTAHIGHYDPKAPVFFSGWRGANLKER